MPHRIAFALILICVLPSFGQQREIDSLHIVLSTTTDDVSRIKTLTELCWHYRFINADTARQYGLRALADARRIESTELEVEALHNVGVTHEAQGNYADALFYEEQALALRKKIGNEAALANTLNNLGVIHDEKGDFNKALDFYFEALRIYEKLNDQPKIAMVAVNMGIVYREMKEYDKVLPNYHKAIGIYKKLNNEFGVAACHANLGSLFLSLKQYDSSLHYSMLASREFEKQQVMQFLSTTYCNAAIAYDSLGQTTTAMKYFITARNLALQYNSKKDLAIVYISLGNIYLRQNLLSPALQNTRKGLQIAAEIGALEQQMQGHLGLSKIYKASGDYELAFEAHTLYAADKDSLFQQEKAKQISELETKYETEKKEQEINIQRLTIAEQDLKLQRNETIVISLVLLIVLGAVVVVLWTGRIKLRHQQQEEQRRRAHQEQLTRTVLTLQEQERSRFAQDLHDSFGQMITALRFQMQQLPASENTQMLVNQMHDEIRNVSFALSPQVLERDGLLAALQELVLRLNHSGRVQLLVRSTRFENRLATEMEVVVYRICQEWINNILKYAQASKVEIQLVLHDEELVVTIEDNGTGFDVSLLEKSTGNGWKNILSRAQVLHGTVDVDSQSGTAGTTFVVCIPARQLLAHTG